MNKSSALQETTPVWIDGVPPEGCKVAWLRVETHHSEGADIHVVLGVFDCCWHVAGDWRGESILDPIEGGITNHIPYAVPDGRLPRAPSEQSHARNAGTPTASFQDGRR